MATWTFVKKSGAPAGQINISVGNDSFSINDTTNTSIVTSSLFAAGELASSPVLTLQGISSPFVPPDVVQDVSYVNGQLVTPGPGGTWSAITAGGGAQAIEQGNFGTTYALNFNSVPGQVLVVAGTLNANCTITVTNPAPGCRAKLLVTQDATGGRTLAISDGIPASMAIDTTASALTVVEVWCASATDVYATPVGSNSSGLQSEVIAHKDQPNGYAGLDAGGDIPVSELPTSAVTDSGTDALGRTQVIGTSSVKAPSLQQFVSVMDAPWNAKGDAKSVTGSINAGTNQLTGTSITSADATKPIYIATAGPDVVQGGSGPTVAGPLNAFIGSVTGGTVSLVTTSGGSTPANATNTVSGAIVRYGTDDTTAWNAAMVAVSAAGTAAGTILNLLAPSGTAFMLGSAVPKNNVRIWAYGATFFFNYGNQPSQKPMFNSYFVPIQGFEIRGATFLGIYAEQADQQCFGTSQANTSAAASSDLSFIDNTVKNWSTGIFYMQNVIRGRSTGNTMSNVCANNGYNAINFSTSNLSNGEGTREIIATHNIIEGCATEGVTLVCAPPSPYITNTVTVRCIFTNNTVDCPLGNGTPITLEFSLGLVGEQSKFIIANNHSSYTGPARNNSVGLIVNDLSTATPTQANMAGPGNPDPEFLNRVVVAGNVVDSVAYGLQVSCSEATVTGNVVTVLSGGGTIGLRVGKFISAMTFVADLANGSATLSNVASANANIVNGTPVSGTNIPAGAYLVSGAGTTTYTLSAPATGAATAQTNNAFAQDKNVIVSHNVIHAPNTVLAANGAAIVEIDNLRDSTVVGNRIFVDAGSGNVAIVGMRVFRCGWIDIENNKINYAPQYGLTVDSCYEFQITRNRIYNPSEGVAGWSGIVFQNLTPSTIARCEGNVVVDDRASHKMNYAVNTGSAGIVALINNELHGYILAPANGTYKMGRGNITDAQTSDLMTITASGTYSIPPGATLLRLTIWGAGGSGGGGGAAGGAAPVTNQVGGSGGASGMFTTVLIPVPAGITTFGITVGAGGAAVAGGAAGNGTSGNAGTVGNNGGSTIITVGAATYTVAGGGGGLGGAANSTTLVSARSWGATGGNTGSAAGNASAGMGGTASSTYGGGAGDGIGPVGGGGGGGCPSSATLGGLGGLAGKVGTAVLQVTATGNAGTAAGGTGGSAAANTGAGGGGGGGGAWNGGTSGAGGASGAGGSGGAWIETIA